MKAYDTKEGIEKYLSDGLPGLARLAKHRSEAGYDRKERLKEWLVLRRYRLDTCGNFMTIIEPVNSEIFFRENVLPWDEAMEKDFRRPCFSSGMAGLPPLDDVCRHCGNGWTLQNAHDFVSRDRLFFHTECYRLKRIFEEKESFEKIFKKAGVPVSGFIAIPNEYWPKVPEYAAVSAPWFLAQLGSLGVIKVGWRKRVIQIDWSNSALAGEIDGNVLFASEDVTKSTNYIHAWGEEKAIEYLTKLSTTPAKSTQEKR